MAIDDRAAGRMDVRDSDMAAREMDVQAKRNGYMNNPNHSNERYKERNPSQIKSSAFTSKNGYAGNSYNYKMKDKLGGLPVPMHMKGKGDCP